VKYPYALPDLEYSYDALEPYIDKETMMLHHTKHHQAYLTNLNAALEKHVDLQSESLESLLIRLDQLPKEVRCAIRNHGGGHYNHGLFWKMMQAKSGGSPVGKLSDEIKKTFGSFEQFRELFSNAAKTRFGSGWAWLCFNKKGLLEICTTANQDSPLESGNRVILGLDVWEHAYYLKYQNKRVDYIQAWWNIVNWEYALERYEYLR